MSLEKGREHTPASWVVGAPPPQLFSGSPGCVLSSFRRREPSRVEVRRVLTRRRTDVKTRCLPPSSKRRSHWLLPVMTASSSGLGGGRGGRGHRRCHPSPLSNGWGRCDAGLTQNGQYQSPTTEHSPGLPTHAYRRYARYGSRFSAVYDSRHRTRTGITRLA